MWQQMKRDGSWIGVIIVSVLALSFIWRAIQSALSGNADLSLRQVGAAAVVLLVLGIAFVIRRRRYGAGPTIDEREVAIRLRGEAVGGVTLLLLFSLVCMVPWLIAVLEGRSSLTIEIQWLPIILAGSWVISGFVRQIVIWRIRRQEERDATQ